jgi:hypothetical protein
MTARVESSERSSNSRNCKMIQQEPEKGLKMSI